MVATMGHKGALGVLPLYWRQHLQALMIVASVWPFLATRNVLVTRNGYSPQPWCPASQWHPFRVAVQCALGTMNSNRSSSSLWGGVQIEGTLEGCEVLEVPPHHPALLTHYTLHKKCP